MTKLPYNIQQRKRASSYLALAETEISAAETLLEHGLFRETVGHIYHACLYVSRALLCGTATTKTSNKGVLEAMKKQYGKKDHFPKRYLNLLAKVGELQKEFDFRSSHSPEPSRITCLTAQAAAYRKFARNMIDEVRYDDLLRDLVQSNHDKIKDFSIDIYCPKTYSHHTRMTAWFPPFYLDVFRTGKLKQCVSDALKRLRVKKTAEYVAGLNSKLNQYEDVHLLMFDIDSVDAEVEATLKNIGGILLKSGRGYHFIGRKVIEGRKEWIAQMKKTLRDPVLKKRVDKRHIEISLQRGYSTLRITSSPAKPSVPQFFKEF